MIKIVLDTNVYLSALFWKGAPHEIFVKSLEGEVMNYTSPSILQEVEDKLLTKFQAPQEKVQELLQTIIFSSTVVRPSKKLTVVKDDPTDDKVIECAIEGGASFIVTGDRHLLVLKDFQGIEMVTPRQFLENLHRSKSDDQ